MTAQPAAVVDALFGILAVGERRRAERLPAGFARDSFIVTRATLRQILARYVGTDAASLEFHYGAAGKPSLAGYEDPALHFSVSHTRDLSVVAVTTEREIGVDIEAIRAVRRPARIAERLFADPTAATIRHLPERERPNAFLAAWTQREAFVKAIGTRLWRGSATLPFAWPRSPETMHVVPSADGASRVWTIAAIEPSSQHVGTVVITGTDIRIDVRDAPVGHAS